MPLQEGDLYRCEQCGAEIQVNRSCNCSASSGDDALRCCGAQMKPVMAAARRAIGQDGLPIAERASAAERG